MWWFHQIFTTHFIKIPLYKIILFVTQFFYKGVEKNLMELPKYEGWYNQLSFISFHSKEPNKEQHQK